MSNPTLVLWCDGVTNRILSGWQSNQLAQIPKLKQGDSVLTEIHWLASYGVYSAEEVIFPPSATVTLAIGLVGEYPTGGTYKITYNGDTTSALPYNASLAVVEAALNGLPSIIADGGVDVEGDVGTKKIIWREVGARTEEITINTDGLTPTSQSEATIYRNGDAEHTHILLLSISQAPVAVCSTFEASPQPSITTTLVLTNTWRVKIYPYPKAGAFQLSFTAGFNTYTAASIPYDATADNIATSLNAQLSSTSAQFTVSQVGQYTWDIVCPSTVITIDDIETSIGSFSASSAMIGFSSILGTLNLNTANLEEFLSGYEERDAIIEIQVDVDGNVQTIAHSDVTLVNDLINSAMFNIVERTDVMPVDSVVRYDTSQGLTTPQKETARNNIDAAANEDVTTLQSTVYALEGELSALSYSILTVSQRDAVAGAESPSSSNVFITNSVLTTSLADGLATKANLVHTHIATDITDSTSAGRGLLTSANAASQRTLLGLGSMALESSLDYMDQDTQFLTFATLNSPTFIGLPVLSSSGMEFSDGTIQTTAVNSSLYAPIDSPHFTGLPWLGSSGIKFSDGTIQTTAATGGGGGSYLPLTDGGTITNTASGATTIIDGYYISANYDGYNARAELNPIGTGVYDTSGGTSALLLPTIGLVLSGGTQGITFPDGTTQTTAATGGGSYLESANNLSDVAYAPTARANLGLGDTSSPTFDGITTSGGIGLDGSPYAFGSSYIGAQYFTMGIAGESMTMTPGELMFSYSSFSPSRGIYLGTSAPFGGGFGVWIYEYGSLKCGMNMDGFVFGDATTLTTRPVNGVQNKPGGATYTKEIKIQDADGTWYWVAARLA